MITEENGVKIVTFGNGTTLVGSANAVMEGDIRGGALFFNSVDKKPFGTPHPDCLGKEVIDNGAEVLIFFPDTRSVDLVITFLENIKSIIEDVDE